MTRQEDFPQHLSKKGAVSVLWVSGCWRNPRELHPFSRDLSPQIYERKILKHPRFDRGNKVKRKNQELKFAVSRRHLKANQNRARNLVREKIRPQFSPSSMQSPSRWDLGYSLKLSVIQLPNNFLSEGFCLWKTKTLRHSENRHFRTLRVTFFTISFSLVLYSSRECSHRLLIPQGLTQHQAALKLQQ